MKNYYTALINSDLYQMTQIKIASYFLNHKVECFCFQCWGDKMPSKCRNSSHFICTLGLIGSRSSWSLCCPLKRTEGTELREIQWPIVKWVLSLLVAKDWEAGPQWHFLIPWRWKYKCCPEESSSVRHSGFPEIPSATRVTHKNQQTTREQTTIRAAKKNSRQN